MIYYRHFVTPRYHDAVTHPPWDGQASNQPQQPDPPPPFCLNASPHSIAPPCGQPYPLAPEPQFQPQPMEPTHPRRTGASLQTGVPPAQPRAPGRARSRGIALLIAFALMVGGVAGSVWLGTGRPGSPDSATAGSASPTPSSIASPESLGEVLNDMCDVDLSAISDWVDPESYNPAINHIMEWTTQYSHSHCDISTGGSSLTGYEIILDTFIYDSSDEAAYDYHIRCEYDTSDLDDLAIANLGDKACGEYDGERLQRYTVTTLFKDVMTRISIGLANYDVGPTKEEMKQHLITLTTAYLKVVSTMS